MRQVGKQLAGQRELVEQQVGAQQQVEPLACLFSQRQVRAQSAYQHRSLFCSRVQHRQLSRRSQVKNHSCL